MAITWQILTNIKQLSSISTEWHELNQASNHGCLFTSPEWQLNWLEVYWQKNWHLYSFAAYQENKLIALLPFYYQKTTKVLSQQHLFFIGQGEAEQAEVASEYLDILMHHNYAKQLLPYCIKKLSQTSFDSFSARAVTKTANILKVIAPVNYKPCGIQYQTLTAHWQITQLSKNTRSKIKRTTKRLHNSNAQFVWVSNEEQLFYWDKMAQFHQKRWLKKNYTGAFSQDDFHDFHRNLINNNFTTAMSILIINNQAVAINYYLIDNDYYYFYQSGWDEEKFNHLSPGFALHIWSIENCPAQKYDFMMGNSNDSYKSKFNCNRHELFTISVQYKPVKRVLLKLLQKIFSN